MQTCVPSTSGMSEIAAYPPSPIADDPTISYLLSLLQSVNFSCLFTQCQPLYASCCTVLPYFSRYCTVRLKCFIFCVCLFFMYYLYEKYCKPIITVQYYIADCVSWVPKLTLLDLRTNWTYECVLGTELVRK